MTDSPRRAPLIYVALAAAPALGLVSELLVPRDTTTNAADELTFVAAHSTTFLAADLLAITAAALFALGLPALLRRIIGRGQILARIACGLATAGALGLIAHGFLLLAVRDLAVAADPAAMAPASDAISQGVGAMLVLVLRLFGFDLGLGLLTIALWRARLMPGWLAPAGFVALIADFSPLSWNAVLMYAALLVAFGAMAITAGQSAGTIDAIQVSDAESNRLEVTAPR